MAAFVLTGSWMPSVQMTHLTDFQRFFLEHQQVCQETAAQCLPVLAPLAEALAQDLLKGRRLFVCGNGGSAAQSQHLASELVNRFRKNRRALPALALTTDSSALTSIANDDCFENVFSRQLAAFAQTGDWLVVFSTSGNSSNILRAVLTAQNQALRCLGFSGAGDHALAQLLQAPDGLVAVPSRDTARIQEMHLLLVHVLCSHIEEFFQ